MSLFISQEKSMKFYIEQYTNYLTQVFYTKGLENHIHCTFIIIFL